MSPRVGDLPPRGTQSPQDWRVWGTGISTGPTAPFHRRGKGSRRRDARVQRRSKGHPGEGSPTPRSALPQQLPEEPVAQSEGSVPRPAPPGRTGSEPPALPRRGGRAAGTAPGGRLRAPTRSRAGAERTRPQPLLAPIRIRAPCPHSPPRCRWPARAGAPRSPRCDPSQ